MKILKLLIMYGVGIALTVRRLSMGWKPGIQSHGEANITRLQNRTDRLWSPHSL